MKKQIGKIWARARPALLALLGLYLDDLLLVAAGACFVAAAGRAFGESAALAVAGVCFLGYGVVVAKARKGDGQA